MAIFNFQLDVFQLRDVGKTIQHLWNSLANGACAEHHASEFTSRFTYTTVTTRNGLVLLLLKFDGE